MSDPLIIKILERRKRIKKAKAEMSADSTAIGDMAFLLLIFFIVTSSFILRQGIFLSLPSAQSSAIKMDKSRLVEIYPESDGFTYNEKRINRAQLAEVLTRQKEEFTDSVVIIRMKPEVKYDRLIDTLSLARETGLNRVSLKNTSGAE